MVNFLIASFILVNALKCYKCNEKENIPCDDDSIEECKGTFDNPYPRCIKSVLKNQFEGKFKGCQAINYTITGCFENFPKVGEYACFCDTDLCNGIQKIFPQISILVVSILVPIFQNLVN